jgi:hypothetical protein
MEYDDSSGELYNFQTGREYFWPEGDVVKVFDWDYSYGVRTYSFTVSILSGNADLGIALYGAEPYEQPIYVPKDATSHVSNNSGAGQDETLVFTLPDEPNPSPYAFVVWAENSGWASYTIDVQDPTGVVEEVEEDELGVRIHGKSELAQNEPNPFNPSTTIRFGIPGVEGEAQPVLLMVYDVRGRKVRTLANSIMEPGRHLIRWNGRDDQGRMVTSGVYFYTLQTRGRRFVRKMTMLK